MLCDWGWLVSSVSGSKFWDYKCVLPCSLYKVPGIKPVPAGKRDSASSLVSSVLQMGPQAQEFYTTASFFYPSAPNYSDLVVAESCTTRQSCIVEGCLIPTWEQSQADHRLCPREREDFLRLPIGTWFHLVPHLALQDVKGYGTGEGATPFSATSFSVLSNMK